MIFQIFATLAGWNHQRNMYQHHKDNESWYYGEYSTDAPWVECVTVNVCVWVSQVEVVEEKGIWYLWMVVLKVVVCECVSEWFHLRGSSAVRRETCTPRNWNILNWSIFGNTVEHPWRTSVTVPSADRTRNPHWYSTILASIPQILCRGPEMLEK